MTKAIAPELSAAWRTLKNFAFTTKGSHCRPQPWESELAQAIDVLDNSDFMVPVEDAAHEADATPRTPVVIENNGPLFQARGADDRIWSTATTYKRVEEHLAELPISFIVCGPEELATPALDPAEWGDTTREDMARHQRGTCGCGAPGVHGVDHQD